MCLTCGCGTNEVFIRGRQPHRAGKASAPARFRPHVTEATVSDASHIALSHVNESPLEFPHENQKHTLPSGRRGELEGDPPSNPPPGEGVGESFEFKIGDEDASRIVKLEQDILAKNDAHATTNRNLFAEAGILALNLVSSPGSGKTTLLVRTLEMLKGRLPVAVVEGDQQTENDAERIRATGVEAIQINTGKGCHLDAQMIEHALQQMAMPQGGVLFIENVGNLVCPSAFDLGEAAKVVVLSVTEGEDKPLKYPDMFRAAKLMLLNKCDLLPHLSFDVARVEEYARRVNPDIVIIRLSATTGEGLGDWLAWLDAQRAV
ncbi:MAG: hydrogenase nickel incorporation protein HypB [Nitrosomonadales bacterium]|nr:hydrogenase nickel incorporation protein HypB [Nitrosomonadales bacterium]